MSANPDIKRCPNCTKRLRTGDPECQACVQMLASDPAGQGTPHPEAVGRHRGERIVKLAVVSGLLFFVGGWVLGFAGYFWNGTIQSILPFLGFGVPALVFGQFCGVFAIVFACRDLLGMRVGRVDKAGRWPTVFGGLLAVLSVQAYWLMIGLALRNLL